jgi:myo-inositol-1(or 4)-monophosphatase
VWVIDPVDGTHNFVRAYPGFCVSVGLVHDGASLVGVIYDAATDVVFWAVQGAGAWREDGGAVEQLSVSAKATLSTAMITTGFTSTSAADPTHIAVFADLLDAAAGTRVSGSACRDLCFVAAGKIDLFWQFHIRPWDVAAGRLLVQEAGGRVELEIGDGGLLSGGPLVIFAGTPGVVAEALTRRARIVNA